MPVLDPQHLRPVGVVAAGLAPEIGGLDRRHQDFLRAGAVGERIRHFQCGARALAGVAREQAVLDRVVGKARRKIDSANAKLVTVLPSNTTTPAPKLAATVVPVRFPLTRTAGAPITERTTGKGNQP
jgi:hypothetical protein